MMFPPSVSRPLKALSGTAAKLDGSRRLTIWVIRPRALGELLLRLGADANDDGVPPVASVVTD